ncbi:probable polygalacturonase At3g15720 [Fagus crenata]
MDKRIDHKKNFNVISYGAVGNGKTDDTEAFQKAWEDLCKATQESPILSVPKGKIFLLQSVQFSGPCKSNKVLVQIAGSIVAPTNINAWSEKEAWIKFADIDGLTINGGGQIDGQGSVWWNACTDKKHCDDRPTALHFQNCNGLQLSKLSHLNSPKNHISISGCNNVYISDLRIFAPEDSPNTDGIDIAHSSNVRVLNTVMETGDDCIAINDGSSYINISGIACGPGHGISIGSLGKDGAYNTVEEIHVSNCNFTGTQNAARIKTWQGGSGYARKITFENINIIDSQNPIIIDQDYNPNSVNSGSQSAVKVSDVTFRNVRGTSADELAIDLVCSDNTGCTNISLQQINITSAIPGKQTYSRCNNAHGITKSTNPIVPCLSQ